VQSTGQSVFLLLRTFRRCSTPCAAAHHAARLKAEAEAQDAAQRLAVAQQQIAEYAAAKAADVEALVQHSNTLDGLLSRLISGLRASAVDGGATGSGSGGSAAQPGSSPVTDAAAGPAAAAGPPDTGAAALAALSQLRERLQETASEASAFAALQSGGADGDRAKRSSAQVSSSCRPVDRPACARALHMAASSGVKKVSVS
jgi:hypothetical protein